MYGRDQQGNQESSVCMGEISKVIRSPLFVWERSSRLSGVLCLYWRDHQGYQEFSLCMGELIKVIRSPPVCLGEIIKVIMSPFVYLCIGFKAQSTAKVMSSRSVTH